MIAKETSIRREFNFEKAFSRNIGFITDQELESLRNKKIAIAGMGGVGGSHLLVLTRLGISNFHIADFDTYDLVNFNRQILAKVSTIGHSKADVLKTEALDINPEANIKVFSDGVTETNIDEFLDGVDLYVDGLDAFQIKMRRVVFAECHRRGIPGTTVAPIGMGAALINFLPGYMSFEDYFGLEGLSKEDQLTHFAAGLAPKALHLPSLIDRSKFNLYEEKAASTPMGCFLSSGVAATEALKILLHRGKVYAAPYAIQYDAYTNRLSRTWMPFGYKNPVFKLKVFLVKTLLRRAQNG